MECISNNSFQLFIHGKLNQILNIMLICYDSPLISNCLCKYRIEMGKKSQYKNFFLEHLLFSDSAVVLRLNYCIQLSDNSGFLSTVSSVYNLGFLLCLEILSTYRSFCNIRLHKKAFDSRVLLFILWFSCSRSCLKQQWKSFQRVRKC